MDAELAAGYTWRCHRRIETSKLIKKLFLLSRRELSPKTVTVTLDYGGNLFNFSNKRCNMNDHGIPIIEPTVDFTKVPPIHQKRTITFVNHFIIHTVQFLNNFALCCEEKLFEFENKLQRVEASLEILESRLSSIPEANSPAKTESPTQIEFESKVEKEEIKPDVPDVVENTEPSEEKNENSNMQPLSKDPIYAKYFKMVQFGVPAQAVKLKMKQEGLDPLMLDNPSQMVRITEVVDVNTTTDEETDA